MSKNILKLLAVGVLCSANVWAGAYQADSPAKVFTGPEGERVTLVPLQGAKMLVKFEQVGGEGEGVAKVYEHETKGERQEVYENRKRGSKTHRYVILSKRSPGAWTFQHPAKPAVSFNVSYSESASKGADAEKLIQQIK